MADDDNTKEPVKEEVVEESQDQSTEVETTEESQEETTETPEAEAPQEPEAPAEETEEVAEEKGEELAPPQPSRRESLRIQQLIQKMKQPTAPAKEEQPAGLDYRTALDADDEVINQLETDRRTYGESQRAEALKQVEAVQFHTRLEIDAPKVESKYPQLNKESDQFDPVAADDINSLYLQLVGYNPADGTVQNPNLRYADFAEAQMGLSDRLAAKRQVETVKNVAKQAASTGLRPDGSSAKRLNLSKAPEDMTEEELNAAVSQTLPRDPRGRFLPQK